MMVLLYNKMLIKTLLAALVVSAPCCAMLCPKRHNSAEPRVNYSPVTLPSLSSVNKDYYRESAESIPLSVQSMGSTEYIVLPNHGKGIGIGISGKSGVIIRNILQGSIADKVCCLR